MAKAAKKFSFKRWADRWCRLPALGVLTMCRLIQKWKYPIVLAVLVLVLLGKYRFDFGKLIEILHLPVKETCSIAPKHLIFNVSDMPIRRRFNIKNPYNQPIYDVKIFVEVQGVEHKVVDVGIEREGATPSEAGPEDSVIVLGCKSKKYQGKIIYIRNLPPGNFGMFLTFNQSGRAFIWEPEYSVIDEGVGIRQSGEFNFQDVAPKIFKSQGGSLEGMKVMLFKR